MFPGVITGLQVEAYSVGVKILVGFKSVIFEGFCNSFDIVHDQAQVVLINWM